MTRNLYCEKCKPGPLHPEDVAIGWKQRTLTGFAKKPKEHFLLINGERHDLHSLICDQCGGEIKDGTKAIGVTMWRGEEPDTWEHEYLRWQANPMTDQREALSEILKMAKEHPAFDEVAFDARDIKALCNVGGDVCDWTMIAIIADDALNIKRND